MDLYIKLLIFYAVMSVISGFITYFLTQDTRTFRILSAFLVGATWPVSFPVALLISLI
ncbi:GhoT/OrtT family toxin [Kosakonia sp.]|uniref:GhoT/OrtT family toxin n=1 Tax=Kosakonia sp. TaxID=1916651 RepID=UPI00289794B0|nr:GhoT/OrtT family toxin [Kosakonia sp.]